jgi:L-cysteine:1D-myo-inositol 2-amino-2-deoxy-alpha-D-glucopyranoside ligase
MRLFDTLTQREQTLKPLGDRVTLYVCGITPYDTTHLGHAFLNVVYDTLVRALRWQGQTVEYVQNVTDIDDDILRKAREVGMAWDELGAHETERYLKDLRALSVEVPDHYVRASDEIATIIALTEKLLAAGLAYERDGWVYFHVRGDPGFGKLADAGGYIGYDAWLKTANERGNFPDDPRKQDPLDFVLWQAQQPDEPAWPSPWGMGRPGWHIECSAMSTARLGPRIDIHGGGTDLVFPHHTCEIAQSENATGERPFVGIWMHVAMVRQDGEKMSKSLGNLTRVAELLPTYTGAAIRLLLLGYHYRDSWEYHPADMARAAARLRRLQAAAAVASYATDLDTAARDAFAAALNDDLRTPAALAVLDGLAERALTTGDALAVASLRALAAVMGVSLDATAAAPADSDVIGRGAV